MHSETKEHSELVSVLPRPFTFHVPFEGFGRSYIANVDEVLGEQLQDRTREARSGTGRAPDQDFEWALNVVCSLRGT